MSLLKYKSQINPFPRLTGKSDKLIDHGNLVVWQMFKIRQHINRWFTCTILHVNFDTKSKEKIKKGEKEKASNA